jgi:predicted MFS family arabinose efflux permease
MLSRSYYVPIPEVTLNDDRILNGDEGLANAPKNPVTEWSKGVDETSLALSHELSNEKIIMGIGYMLAMGVCGTVLVALGSTLEDLAENVGKTSTEVGTVFITRGSGAILGAIFSAKLYKWFPGNTVMFIGLSSISCLLIAMPFVKSNIILHAFFLLLGLGTAVTDTGCQIMTRKLHGKMAGPWLGANTVSFGISGAFVPVIELFTSSLYIQYFAVTGIVLIVALVIGLGPNPERNGRLPSCPLRGSDGRDFVIPHYHVEIVIAIMVFFFIGGKVTTTAYLATYVNETDVLKDEKGTYLVLVLWIAITVGRLAGVHDQRFLSNKTLPIHLTIFCVGGFLSMLLIIWFPKNSQALWIGVAFYGLFNGPCVGYCYDLNNRMTHPSEASMSIVMFGLNFGASLIPYVTSMIWNMGGGPRALIQVTFATMLIPLPLLHLTKYLSYDSRINPRLRFQYETLVSSDSTHGGATTGTGTGTERDIIP